MQLRGRRDTCHIRPSYLLASGLGYHRFLLGKEFKLVFSLRQEGDELEGLACLNADCWVDRLGLIGKYPRRNNCTEEDGKVYGEGE
jgi:hypothetical protein